MFHLITAFLYSLTILFAQVGIDAPLKGLFSNTSTGVSLRTLMRGNSVFFAFRPDCGICHAQVKEFRCLKGKAKVLAFGFDGTKKELWREGNSMGLKIEGINHSYMLTKDGFKELNLTPKVSPQILIFKNNQMPIHIIGYQECGKLEKYF